MERVDRCMFQAHYIHHEFSLKKTIVLILLYGDKFTYSDIKSNFSALEGCFWNGPMRDEKTDGEIVLFTNDDERNGNITRVANGWKHIYTGCGNHLLIKDIYFPIFNKYISEYESPVEIYCSWQKHIDDFIKEITSI